MAEEEEKEQQGEGDEPKTRKSGAVKAVTMAFVIVAVGSIGGFMAVPSKAKPEMKGPYSAPLISKEEKFAVNLTDNNNTRFLQLVIHCEYLCYDELYVKNRASDKSYVPALRSELGRVTSTKGTNDLYSGPNREAFIAELQETVEPILFPVHIGITTKPQDADPESGLRPGVSYHKADFRGSLHDCMLTVDGEAKTLCLENGAEVTFEPHEDDVWIADEAGYGIYVDVTGLKQGFSGEIPVGVHGRIRRLHLPEFIIQ